MIDGLRTDKVEPSPSHAAVLNDLWMARFAIVHGFNDVLIMAEDNIAMALGPAFAELTVDRLVQRHDPAVEPVPNRITR